MDMIKVRIQLRSESGGSTSPVNVAKEIYSNGGVKEFYRGLDSALLRQVVYGTLRLGIYFNPIVLLNTRNYYAALQTFMQQVVDEKFMNAEHIGMWSLVDSVEAVLPEILATPKWREDARAYAVVR